jgi:hypothetical protein
VLDGTEIRLYAPQRKPQDWTDLIGRTRAPCEWDVVAPILSPTLFSMMVIIALATTLMTQPPPDWVVPSPVP